MTDLIAAFAALPRPSQAGAYSVARARSNCRVGRTFDGFPAVLVELSTDNGMKLPRRLANFAYQPPAAVQIRSDSELQSAQLAIVECCTHDRRLASYFFRIVAEVLMPEAEAGDEARFEAAVDAVVTLFKALQRPAAHTVQGLWSELAIIAFSSNAHVALSSWHSSSRALHDFANGGARLEVKSTTKGLREHVFLLDQLRLGERGHVLIASMLLTESSAGHSVFDLAHVIRERLTHPLARNRLEAIIADSLGNGFEAVEEHLYDLDGARESLLLYRAEDVPICLLPLPAQVKDVSFTVDLSTTIPLSLDDSRKLSPQFCDLLPT
ncbi:MAG: PD-(D/E)XK motif protein [bacterium]